MLKKKGMLCVGRLEKNNPFFYSSFDFANGGKGRILAVEHILGPVKCSWRIWVAHCSCAAAWPNQFDSQLLKTEPSQSMSICLQPEKAVSKRVT